jgi:hypothetical protein
MLLPTLLTTALFTLTRAAPAADAEVSKRIPILAAFGAYPDTGCPVSEINLVQLAYGATKCGECRTFGPTNTTMLSLNEFSCNPVCVLTVYQKDDCSDPGIQSGLGGCWWPEGGFKGYTVTCPWYTPQAGSLAPCAPGP